LNLPQGELNPLDFEIKDNHMIKEKKKVLGFTLIELMVAIAIIAVLAAVGMVVYSTAQKSGRISKRVQDLDSLRTALELYKSATGFYPSHTTASSFTCITGANGVGGPLAPLSSAYMPVLPADPLDGGNSGGTNCYQYASSGTSNSTDYKLRTNLLIYGTSGEMNSTAFQTQPGLIDPDRDTTVDDNCAIQTTGTTRGWAIHSGLAAMCNLDAT